MHTVYICEHVWSAHEHDLADKQPRSLQESVDRCTELEASSSYLFSTGAEGLGFGRGPEKFSKGSP